MDDLYSRPSLVLPLATYHNYFERAKTNTFCGHYVNVPPPPYKINAADSAASATPAEIFQKIYAAAQEGVFTVFLQWHQIIGGRGTQIALLHLVSSYVPHMGMPPPPWDDLSFVSKEEVTCGVVVCANWLMAKLHQIGAMVHVPMAQAIHVALSADPKTDLLGPFTTDDADVDAIHVQKTIYLPSPFTGIFLERDLALVQAWSRLCGDIFEDSATVDFCPIIGWIQVALTRKIRYYQPYPLAMP